jgi:hypothetical protein
MRMEAHFDICDGKPMRTLSSFRRRPGRRKMIANCQTAAVNSLRHCRARPGNPSSSKNGLAKIDGCPGHLARRRASRFCPGMTSVDISTPDTQLRPRGAMRPRRNRSGSSALCRADTWLQPVARMERSAIRDRNVRVSRGFRCAPFGLRYLPWSLRRRKRQSRVDPVIQGVVC